jgi:predicted HTH domain antitoxin
MSEVLSVRPDKEDLKFIRVQAREERIPTSTYLKKILHEAVQEKRIEKALERMKANRVTLREAADLAGISVLELMERAAQAGVQVLGNMKTSLKRQIENI